MNRQESVPSPYISFIATSRNDNYGGNLVQEIQVFIDGLVHLCEKYRLRSELILVDWNPPENKPKLKEEFTFPSSLSYLSIRFIEVPLDVHRKVKDSEKFYLLEYIGKNVGVRRARGEYILVTNPDNFFSESFIKMIAERRLSKKYFYRIGRANLKYPIPLTLKSYEERISFAKKNIDYFNSFIKVCRNNFTQKYNPLRWIKNFVVNFVIPTLTHYPFQAPAMNTPGDFILMHRDHWFYLRGFQEYSPLTGRIVTGPDGLMVYMALTLGLKQKYLTNPFSKMILYSQPQDNTKFIPSYGTTMAEYNELFRKMIKDKKPIIANGENWGLSDIKLKEEVVLNNNEFLEK